MFTVRTSTFKREGELERRWWCLWRREVKQSFQFYIKFFKTNIHQKQALCTVAVCFVSVRKTIKHSLLHYTVRQEVKLCLKHRHTHTHTHTHTLRERITSAEKHENSCWWFYMVMDHCLIPNPRNAHYHTHTHTHTHTHSDLSMCLSWLHVWLCVTVVRHLSSVA